jgi:hypothetical protein
MKAEEEKAVSTKTTITGNEGLIKE